MTIYRMLHPRTDVFGVLCLEDVVVLTSVKDCVRVEETGVAT